MLCFCRVGRIWHPRAQKWLQIRFFWFSCEITVKTWNFSENVVKTWFRWKSALQNHKYSLGNTNILLFHFDSYCSTPENHYFLHFIAKIHDFHENIGFVEENGAPGRKHTKKQANSMVFPGPKSPGSGISRHFLIFSLFWWKSRFYALFTINRCCGWEYT